jgi:hypothetical protein
MSNPIDLSKYAKGAKLRCVDADGSNLEAGLIYDSHGIRGDDCVMVEADGTGWLAERFIPVEDEAPGFKPGDRVRYTGAASWVGTVVRLCDGTPPSAIVDWGRHGELDAWLSNLELVGAPPVAASPKTNRFRGPQAWSIPTGTACCAVCAVACAVKDASDLFTAEDGKDYPLCGGCWNNDDGGETWELATNAAILRKTNLSDSAIAALMTRRDAKARDLAAELDRPATPRHPPEGRSDRVTGYRRWGQS